MFNAESFGDTCPRNWEEIAEFLNETAEERGITEDRDAMDALWEDYWRGDLEDAPEAILPYLLYDISAEMDHRPANVNEVINAVDSSLWGEPEQFETADSAVMALRKSRNVASFDRMSSYHKKYWLCSVAFVEGPDGDIIAESETPDDYSTFNYNDGTIEVRPIRFRYNDGPVQDGVLVHDEQDIYRNGDMIYGWTYEEITCADDLANMLEDTPCRYFERQPNGIYQVTD